MYQGPHASACCRKPSASRLIVLSSAISENKQVENRFVEEPFSLLNNDRLIRTVEGNWRNALRSVNRSPTGCHVNGQTAVTSDLFAETSNETGKILAD